MSREQDIERTLNQDFVASVPYNMPIEVVSVRVREHPHEERTPSGVVSWTEQVEWERKKKFKGGRCGIKWNFGTEHERQTLRDGEKTKGKECDQIFRTEARILSVFWERMICLWNSDEEIVILLGNSSIFNQQSTITVNGWTEIGEKQTEFIVTQE